jgi:hypothetical protein
VADQAANDALIEDIGNQEPFSLPDFIKWMKKEESRSKQETWKKGENEMKTGRHQ